MSSIIPKQEFLDAGSDLYAQLNRGVEGIDNHGMPTLFRFGHNESVRVEPISKPPFTTEIGLPQFIEALGKGVAGSTGVEVTPVFPVEVDVLTYAILLPLRRDAVDNSMNHALYVVARQRRNPMHSQFLHAEACVEAVKAEEMVRHTLFGIDSQYARYEELAEEYEQTGKLNGFDLQRQGDNR